MSIDIESIEEKLKIARTKKAVSPSNDDQLRRWRVLTEQICEKQAKAGNLQDIVREIAVVLYRISRIKE